MRLSQTTLDVLSDIYQEYGQYPFLTDKLSSSARMIVPALRSSGCIQPERTAEGRKQYRITNVGMNKVRLNARRKSP
jgi:hypothetical protein